MFLKKSKMKEQQLRQLEDQKMMLEQHKMGRLGSPQLDSDVIEDLYSGQSTMKQADTHQDLEEMDMEDMMADMQEIHEIFNQDSEQREED